MKKKKLGNAISIMARKSGIRDNKQQKNWLVDKWIKLHYLGGGGDWKDELSCSQGDTLPSHKPTAIGRSQIMVEMPSRSTTLLWGSLSVQTVEAEVLPESPAQYGWCSGWVFPSMLLCCPPQGFLHRLCLSSQSHSAHYNVVW